VLAGSHTVCVCGLQVIDAELSEMMMTWRCNSISSWIHQWI